MEENHKTKQQEDGHVSKPMGQLGFDLFKEKNATGGIMVNTDFLCSLIDVLLKY